MIGFFLSIIFALRTDNPGDPTFRKLLDWVREYDLPRSSTREVPSAWSSCSTPSASLVCTCCSDLVGTWLQNLRLLTTPFRLVRLSTLLRYLVLEFPRTVRLWFSVQRATATCGGFVGLQALYLHDLQRSKQFGTIRYFWSGRRGTVTGGGHIPVHRVLAMLRSAAARPSRAHFSADLPALSLAGWRLRF